MIARIVFGIVNLLFCLMWWFFIIIISAINDNASFWHFIKGIFALAQPLGFAILFSANTYFLLFGWGMLDTTLGKKWYLVIGIANILFAIYEVFGLVTLVEAHSWDRMATSTMLVILVINATTFLALYEDEVISEKKSGTS